jgi:hypothetical protein
MHVLKHVGRTAAVTRETLDFSPLSEFLVATPGEGVFLADDGAKGTGSILDRENRV